MEGGMTRRRGYVWLTILFLVATGVLLASQPKGTSPSLPPLPDSLVPTTDSLSPSSQPNPLAPTASVWHAIPQKKPLVFELNSADSLDLVQLYNIGPTIARRILKYRSLLGGYFCKEQLHEVQHCHHRPTETPSLSRLLPSQSHRSYARRERGVQPSVRHLEYPYHRHRNL